MGILWHFVSQKAYFSPVFEKMPKNPIHTPRGDAVCEIVKCRRDGRNDRLRVNLGSQV